MNRLFILGCLGIFLSFQAVATDVTVKKASDGSVDLNMHLTKDEAADYEGKLSSPHINCTEYCAHCPDGRHVDICEDGDIAANLRAFKECGGSFGLSPHKCHR